MNQLSGKAPELLKQRTTWQHRPHTKPRQILATNSSVAILDTLSGGIFVPSPEAVHLLLLLLPSIDHSDNLQVGVGCQRQSLQVLA